MQAIMYSQGIHGPILFTVPSGPWIPVKAKAAELINKKSFDYLNDTKIDMRKNIYEFYFGRSFDSAEKIKDEGKLKGNKNASFCQKGSSAKILEFHSVKIFFFRRSLRAYS